MSKAIKNYILNKGIIECIDKKNETYYLDIEAHIIYTESELLEIIKGGVKNE